MTKKPELRTPTVAELNAWADSVSKTTKLLIGVVDEFAIFVSLNFQDVLDKKPLTQPLVIALIRGRFTAEADNAMIPFAVGGGNYFRAAFHYIPVTSKSINTINVQKATSDMLIITGEVKDEVFVKLDVTFSNGCLIPYLVGELSFAESLLLKKQESAIIIIPESTSADALQKIAVSLGQGDFMTTASTLKLNIPNHQMFSWTGAQLKEAVKSYKILLARTTATEKKKN